MKERLNPFCFVLAAVLVFAITCTVNGQEIAPRVPGEINIWEQPRLRGGRVPGGFVPSWFCLIKVEDRHSGQFLGSGAFITDRVILTCYHNVRGAKNITVKNGPGHQFDTIKILLTSPKLDLALLEVKDERVPYHLALVVSDDDFVPEGTIHTVGFVPETDDICRFEGKLTGKSYGQSGLKGSVTHAVSARIVQGMSGGPTLNNFGEIVGVNVASDGEGLNLTVNLTRIQWFLDQLEVK